MENIDELPHPRDVLTLDIEASSLKGAARDVPASGSPSYPVEVGVAGHKGHTSSYLIKRPEGWTDWNGQKGNERVGFIHGISLDELEESGKDVRFVARWLNRVCTDKVVMCDSPETRCDNFWLDRLFEEAGIERNFDLNFIYDYIDKNDADLDEAYERAGIRGSSLHRAGEDALDLMKLYRRYYEVKQEAKQAQNYDQGFDVPEM